MRDMRGLHAKLPLPAILMSIVGVASMHQLCYRIVPEYYPLIRIIYSNQSSIVSIVVGNCLKNLYTILHHVFLSENTVCNLSMSLGGRGGKEEMEEKPYRRGKKGHGGKNLEIEDN